MTRTLTSTDLAPFYRHAIGIDSLFNRLDHLNRVDSGSSTNYPPYNVIKHCEDEYSIEIAVAGFAEGEVDISFKDGQVVIEGSKTDEAPVGEYLHKGISGRKFVRTFQLAEYIEVKSATMENGILTVSLVRLLPERLQPKKIEIVHKS